jgi:hypothetical protein
MKTVESAVALLGALLVAPTVARPADEAGAWAQAAEPAPPPARPFSPAPTELPPAPPAEDPAPPEYQAQAPAPSAAPAGQWVYTEQYGWVWMPYGSAYTYLPPDGNAPDMYLYYPAVGWCWVVAPWVWGFGPMPYFGVYGTARFGWYGHGFGRWYGYRHAGWYGAGYWQGGRWNGYRRWHVAPSRGGYPAPNRLGTGAPLRPGTAAPHGSGRPARPRTGMVGPPRGGTYGPMVGLAGPRDVARRWSNAAHAGGFGGSRGGFPGRVSAGSGGSGGHSAGGHRGGGRR